MNQFISKTNSTLESFVDFEKVSNNIDKILIKIPIELPGILLREKFIEHFELTSYAISNGTGISQTTIDEILKGKRGIPTKTTCSPFMN